MSKFWGSLHIDEVKEEKIEEKNEEKQIVKQPVSVADDDETDF